MDIVTSKYRWHAKLSTVWLAKKSKYISCCTLNVALYKSPKVVEAEQVGNIIKKCKQEFFENKDIATETIKCNWQIINTVKLSLKTVSVFQ